jgi:hypothetical protein
MGAIGYNSELPTSDTAIITASSPGVVYSGVVAVNATDSAVTLDLSVHRDISGAVETIASSMSIPASTAQMVIDPNFMAGGGITLLTDDSLHASAGTASALSLLVFE